MVDGLICWGVLAESDKKSSNLCRILSLKLWVPVARLSYTIYLTHLFVVRLIEVYFPADRFFALGIRSIAMFVLVFVVAVPIFMLLENPIHQWSKRRSRKAIKI